MENSLWRFANPQLFMRVSGAILPWVAGMAAVGVVLGLVWGFFFTPDDYRQGSTVKIFYLHVPAAMMAINAWAMMVVASVVWLVRRHHVSALAARAAAPIGATMTLIGLITGAIWGQPMWGTWWQWDPRLTSFLVLFLFYIGYIALWAAVDNQDNRRRSDQRAVHRGVGFCLSQPLCGEFLEPGVASGRVAVTGCAGKRGRHFLVSGAGDHCRVCAAFRGAGAGRYADRDQGAPSGGADRAG